MIYREEISSLSDDLILLKIEHAIDFDIINQESRAIVRWIAQIALNFILLCFK